jgi:hypothetical protein
MPIQIPPGPLHDDAVGRIARLTKQTTQLNADVTQQNARIAGNPPTVIGLQGEEDVNFNLYGQYNARLGFFEGERRAIDGVYPNPPVLEADVIQAATTGNGVLFQPPGNLGVDPSPLPQLFGTGGVDPAHETAALAAELADIAFLLTIPVGSRAADSHYADWIVQLTAQQGFLTTEITNASANESYGPLSPAVVAAQNEQLAIAGLLPTPPFTDLDLTNRQTQATARQAFLTTRIATLISDSTPFYNERYLILRGRVSKTSGTLTRLIRAQQSIGIINPMITLNNDTISLYNSLL